MSGKSALITWLVAWAFLSFVQISIGGLKVSVVSGITGSEVSTGWGVAAAVSVVMLSALQAAVFTVMILIISHLLKGALEKSKNKAP